MINITKFDDAYDSTHCCTLCHKTIDLKTRCMYELRYSGHDAIYICNLCLDQINMIHDKYWDTKCTLCKNIQTPKCPKMILSARQYPTNNKACFERNDI